MPVVVLMSIISYHSEEHKEHHYACRCPLRSRNSGEISNILQRRQLLNILLRKDIAVFNDDIRQYKPVGSEQSYE